MIELNIKTKLTREQEDWLQGQLIKLKLEQRLGEKNPCVELHGPGPDGAKCKACAHLFRHEKSRVYLKCDLREFTMGAGSDHKAGWPACSKFSQKI